MLVLVYANVAVVNILEKIDKRILKPINNTIFPIIIIYMLVLFF
jgi:hypothetical protein